MEDIRSIPHEPKTELERLKFQVAQLEVENAKLEFAGAAYRSVLDSVLATLGYSATLKPLDPSDLPAKIWHVLLAHDAGVEFRAESLRVKEERNELLELLGELQQATQDVCDTMTGLECAGWHLNGDLEPAESFFDQVLEVLDEVKQLVNRLEETPGKQLEEPEALKAEYVQETKPALGQFRKEDFEKVLQQEKQLAELGRDALAQTQVPFEKMTVDSLRKILEQNPTLEKGGFYSKGYKFYRGQLEAEKWDLGLLNSLCDWISKYCVATRFYNHTNSYQWKHYAENKGRIVRFRKKHYEIPGIGDYVPNGYFIVAAIYLGFAFKRPAVDHGNCIFKMDFNKDALRGLEAGI